MSLFINGPARRTRTHQKPDRYNSESFEIPELEENSEEEQFTNLDSYIAHHNTYQASKHV